MDATEVFVKVIAINVATIGIGIGFDVAADSSNRTDPLVPVAFDFGTAFALNMFDHFLQAEEALITWLLERTVRAVLGNIGAGCLADARVPRASAAGIIVLGKGSVPTVVSWKRCASGSSLCHLLLTFVMITPVPS